MTEVRMDRKTRLALLSLSGGYFIIGAVGLATVGLVPQMAAGLQVDVPAIAGLITVFSIVYAFAAPTVQVLLGHWPRRVLICMGLLITGAACFASAIAPDYWTTAIARVVMAIGSAMIGATASAAGASLVPEELRSKALALVFLGLTLSTVLGVPLAAYLGQTLGWRSAWAVLGAMTLPPVPFIWVLLGASNRGLAASFKTIKDIVTDRRLSLAISTTGVQMAGQFITYTLLATWLLDVARFSLAAIPLVLALFGFGAVIGNMVSPVLERRFGAPRAIQLLFTLMATCLFLLPFAAIRSELVLIVAFLWATTGPATMPQLQTRLVNLAPSIANVSLALNASGVYVGMAVGSAIGAAVYAYGGAAVLPYCSALGIGLAMLVFRASLKQTQQA